jgi:hypothetical protein
MTEKKRDVVIPPAQLAIISKHFEKVGKLNEQLKAQQDQLTDIFKLIDSVYSLRLADGIDTLDRNGNVIFGKDPTEEPDPAEEVSPEQVN